MSVKRRGGAGVDKDSRPLFLSPREAADLLRVSIGTIHRLCQKKVISCIKLFGDSPYARKKFNRKKLRAELDALMKKQMWETRAKYNEC